MSSVLSVDAVPYRALAWWWGMVRLSLVWWLACLPVVTAPVATVWLVHATRRQLAGRALPGWTESRGLVARHFWPATRLFATHLAIVTLVCVASLGPSPGGALDLVLPLVVLAVALTWSLVGPWSVVLLEQRGDGARAALRASYVRALRRPMTASLGVLGTATCVVAVLLAPSEVVLLVALTAPVAAAAITIRTCDRAGFGPAELDPSTREVP